MVFEIVMLGTSCMVPTKDRNVQAIFVDLNGEGMLFDCGEGTQRQMNIVGINRNRVSKIFLSHWHGDHVSGLVGLLQTLSNSESEQKVMIFGPHGTQERLGHLLKAVSFEDNRISLEVKEVNPTRVEVVHDSAEYFVEAALLDHKMPCVGYSVVEKDKRRINMAKAKKLGLSSGPLIGRLQAGKEVTFQSKTVKPDEVSTVQKGRKLTIILDTQPCQNAYELAKDADLLIAESAYAAGLEEKAAEYKHMTTKQAALIASKSGAKRLVITHFSQRYKSTKELEEEIKAFFKNSECAYDFQKIKL